MERVVVLMTPAEKRALETKAGRLGVPTPELVRRSVDAFDPTIDAEEVSALLDALAESRRNSWPLSTRQSEKSRPRELISAQSAPGPHPRHEQELYLKYERFPIIYIMRYLRVIRLGIGNF